MNDSTTEYPEHPGGWREIKRLRTHRDIEDAATALVDERGFDAVTVDDICARAGISRRTFFNYMDSKDEAVLGTPPLILGERGRETFLTTPSDNLVALAIDLLVTGDDSDDEDPERGGEEFADRLRERRRRIVNAEPALAALSLNRFREQARQLHGLIVAHLEALPGDRKLPDRPVELEARIINGLIRETVWVHLAHPELSPTSESDRGTLLREAAETITNLAKELTW
ncbi:TetR family transcriptional regulator [Corynebacterium halotolerans]|uniref:HTH-type transcriptional regulator n=1 Tax=Corynebacterium halotolerans YIM 70093 = DSM 44683 TaxID=1121362 RepID=M1NKV2_9CORY|nr:TetR/AcrR family transcriptional regulator [Corynebacterium halotolerans]AGF72008.1 HTH-type transcriptional regulator [Corynebacterium halotolerans YIM 70093 = DSM 44683]